MAEISQWSVDFCETYLIWFHYLSLFSKKILMSRIILMGKNDSKNDSHKFLDKPGEKGTTHKYIFMSHDGVLEFGVAQT